MENIYQEPAFIRESFKIIESISKQLFMIKTGEIIDCLTAEYEYEGFDLFMFVNLVHNYLYLFENTIQRSDEYWFNFWDRFDHQSALEFYKENRLEDMFDEESVDFLLLEKNIRNQIKIYIQKHYAVWGKVDFQIREKVLSREVDSDFCESIHNLFGPRYVFESEDFSARSKEGKAVFSLSRFFVTDDSFKNSIILTAENEEELTLSQKI